MSVAPPQCPARRQWGWAAVLLSWIGGAGLSAQILDWEAALGEAGAGPSTFTAVVAQPGADATQPPTAITGGFFEGLFQLGLQSLANPGGEDGVVARFQVDPASGAWDVLWVLQILSSAGESRVLDLATDRNGRFFVTGTYRGAIDFGGSGVGLSSPGVVSGFVAWGDADAGLWLGAYDTPGLLPESIALGEGTAPDVYLTGEGALARCYDDAGTVKWNEPTPAGLTRLTDIALFAAPGVPDVYVLGEDGATNTVALYQLDRATGGQNWERRMGSPGNDAPGGLAVPADGDPRVAFMAQDPNTDFDGIPLPGLPAFPATHALLVRVNTAGGLVWHTPLGLAQNTGDAMKATDVAVDAFGNAFTGASFQGAFFIESQRIEPGDNDAAVLGIDAAGLLFDFHRSDGPAMENPGGVSAPVRGLLVMVGRYEDQPSNWGPLNLPPVSTGEPRAFFSVAAPIGFQQRRIVSPTPGFLPPRTVAEITGLINELGGQIHNTITFASGGVAVAAFLDERAITVIDADPSLVSEPDFVIRPSGTNSDAGWALAHLNDASNTSAAPFSFDYPAPAQTVNVYLLDTAIDNSSGFFTPNPNLTLAATTLVRGAGDPLVSSVFTHGTHMLSLVGGPGTGAAVGVPIALKNFDFYPTGATTTSSLLAQAVYDAIDYQAAQGACRPGIIILASSSVAAGSSITISDAVDEAVAAGMPVVVSAGNSGADASLYTPASKGSTDGVLCIGGSTPKRTREAGSNHGATVDFFAPGQAVRAINFSDPLHGGYDSITGTSASAALAGAVAAVCLSVNPWTTPADLESALKAGLNTGGAVEVVQLAPAGPAFYLDYDDWTAFFQLATVSHAGDDDGDGWTNLQEYFFGLLPCVRDPKGCQTSISYDRGANTSTFRFHVSSVLLDPGKLGTLRDGTTYEVTSDPALASFTATGESLALGGSTGGQTALSQTATASDPACFFRVEITPASPSP